MPEISGPVVAAALSGQVSGHDIDEVLIPAVRRLQNEHASLRLLLYYTPEFRRYTTTAAWEDRTVGLQNLDKFKKVAIVTDTPWISRLANDLGAARPGAVRRFATLDLGDATDWISLP